MALRVREVMNPEVFSLRANDRADDALLTMVGMGLGGAPVVDESNRPIGMVSWSDLVREEGGISVGPRMSKAVEVLRPDDRIEDAARRLAARGFHHAPVLDDKGVLVGFISSMDLLRGLTGVPSRHPGLFPHVEPLTETTWSDELAVDEAGIEAAPAGPGVIAFIDGGAGRPERVIAVEQANNMRARLLDLASGDHTLPILRRAIGNGTLRVRVASLPDPVQRARVAAIAAEHTYDSWFERIGY